MNQFKIATSINIDLEFEIAPFSKRLLAWIFDFVLFIAYVYCMFEFLSLLPGVMTGENEYWTMLIVFLPIALYHIVTEVLLNGQTLGKKVVHIKVINETGGNATISQYLIRWMLRVSDLLLFYMILYAAVFGSKALVQMLFVVALAFTDVMLILFNKKSQRLGDLAAGTILINTKNKGSLNDTIFMELSSDYQPTYPEVMRLTDRDLNMIKNIYKGLQKKYNPQLANRTAEKITTVLNISTNQEPYDFLETLLKDYNHLSTQ